MIDVRCPFLIVAVLVSTVGTTQDTGRSSASAAPPEGFVANNQYVNDYLSFTYPVPDGWQVNDDQLLKHASQAGRILLVLDRHTGRAIRNRIVVGAMKAIDPASGADHIVSVFGNSAKEQQANYELLRDVYRVDLAGQRFFRQDYKQSLDALRVYKADVATKFRGYFLIWEMAAGSKEELEDALRSLEKISFVHPPVVALQAGVSKGLLLKKVQPRYPEAARQMGVQGTVVMKALIDTSGEVRELTLISGDRSLVTAAADAVWQWKYKPHLENGQLTEVEAQIAD